MSYGSGGAEAAYAAIAQAIKASGAIISVKPEAFLTILARNKGGLVVTAPGGWVTRNYQYLTSYKGLIFFTKSKTEITLPGSIEVIAAQQIWIPM
jgi:hypothetical protein